MKRKVLLSMILAILFMFTSIMAINASEISEKFDGELMATRLLPAPTTTHVETPTISYTLFNGTFIVGQDIPAGRYVITSENGDSGNFVIYNTDGRSVINEILHDPTGSRTNGVPSITVDIYDGYEIKISGINNVTFTPAIDYFSNILTTGYWVVGVHISAGQYNARPTNIGDSGNFSIRNANGRLAVSEVLRDNMVRVSLQNGQIIKISSLISVTFEGI